MRSLQLVSHLHCGIFVCLCWIADTVNFSLRLLSLSQSKRSRLASATPSQRSESPEVANSSRFEVKPELNGTKGSRYVDGETAGQKDVDSEGPEDDQNEEEEVDDVDEDELEEAQREIQEAHSHGGVSVHGFEAALPLFLNVADNCSIT